MQFEYLEKDLWPAAKAVISQYKKQGYRVKIERPLKEEDRYRPALIFEKRFSATEIVEIKAGYKLDKPFDEFIQRCLVEQRPIKIWVCVPNHEGDAPSIQVNEEEKYRKSGVGRFYYDGKQISTILTAVECHLRVVLPPGPRLAQEGRVKTAIDKFNCGNRIDGIREMGELLEGAVTNIGLHAKKKGRFSMCDNIDIFRSANFEYRLTRLGMGAEGIRVLEPEVVSDIRAVKNTRNLSDHPRDRRKQRQLNEQCTAKMHEAIRLLMELERIKQRIR